MKTAYISILICSLFSLSFAGISEPNNEIDIGQFSGMSQSDITPLGWRPLVFGNIENHTAYFLTKQNERTVVQAVSNGGASGFYKQTNISPKDFPMINWQWKVANILESADLSKKEGDDYPARIYISFYYDPERLEGMESVKYKLYSLLHDEPPPLAVINYIWDNKTKPDTIVSNAYSERVKMIVIQSGTSNLGKWLSEKRNIIDDYRRAFGEEPGNITGIAIMTDTDNTGESATAWYGDISLSRH